MSNGDRLFLSRLSPSQKVSSDDQILIVGPELLCMNEAMRNAFVQSFPMTDQISFPQFLAKYAPTLIKRGTQGLSPRPLDEAVKAFQMNRETLARNTMTDLDA